MIGKILVHYEVTARLGAGGMGEVYQATDTKLGRKVAIKWLPEAFARDPNRVARFEREAKALAALNHPHIAAIYGLEQSDSSHFLVLELVEGETLAERIRRGPIAVAQAFQIARQIVEALEAAHDKGIVHRDLKPANIKITPEDDVKVLDFGLAKALATEQDAQLSYSPTLSMSATSAGMILGTAAYMSPEQAKGNPNVDKRADIFAFGCVLYEMLTGRQAFQGDSVTEILASVLAREADFSPLPPRLNPKITDLLRRCLEKDVKKRWQAVGDLRVDIENLLSDPTDMEIPAHVDVRHQKKWKFVIAVVACTLLSSIITAGALLWLRPSTPQKLGRFSIVLPNDQEFTRTPRDVVALSPDGTKFVYVANGQLYVRSIDEINSRPIPGTEQDIGSPVFSPDGQWVAFYSFQDSTLKKIAVTGGAAVTLAAVDNPFGVSWEDDKILLGQGSKGIIEVPATGGQPEVVVTVKPGEFAAAPQILPGGKGVLFTLAKGAGLDRWDKADVLVSSKDYLVPKVVIPGGSHARYVPTGHIVYAAGQALLAVPFDIKRTTVTGGPVPVVDSVMRTTGSPPNNTSAANYSFSRDGSLIYVPASSTPGAAPQRVLALASRSGNSKVLDIPPGFYNLPRVSRPGAKQLVIQSGDEGGTLLIYDFSGTVSLRRLTFEGVNSFPAWSPDGRRIAFQSARDGNAASIYWQPSDGSAVAERLTTAVSGEQHRVDSWSADGKTLALTVLRDNDWGIWTLSLSGDRKPELFVDVPNSQQWHSTFSPDGRWLAYASAETGKYQIYVQPFPKTGAKYQVSREPVGGDAPAWSPDGKELFYYQLDTYKLVSVPIRTQPSFVSGIPMPLPIDGIIQGQNFRQYDVMPDGNEFLTLLPSAKAGLRPTEEIHIVLNWFDELKRRVVAQ